MNKLIKNYDQWKVQHYRWNDIESFTATKNLSDGIHTVTIPSGVEVDLFIRGNPFELSERSVLTFFGGAVSQRSTKLGPFFSGLGIAGQLNIPIIAIADPGIEVDTKINLAWYTGGAGHKLQDGISSILDSLAARVQGEILLVGGSGGGYAALYYATRLRYPCSVFVWNPQTDVFKYIDTFVRSYLNHLFKYSTNSLSGPDWIRNTRKRAGFHADLSILDNDFTKIPRRLFYLQNATDWHTQEHLKPFLDSNRFEEIQAGLYQTDPEHVCLVAHAAQGHLPPPVEILQAVISVMSVPTVSSLLVAEKVLAMIPIADSNFENLPKLI